ncbi:MAG: hypothetical protein PHZ02_09330 [Desulfocapsaceae bacterium]|nr:hypothetical protein [Desulfocapsaceae bacterium]
MQRRTVQNQVTAIEATEIASICYYEIHLFFIGKILADVLRHCIRDIYCIKNSIGKYFMCQSGQVTPAAANLKYSLVVIVR